MSSVFLEKRRINSQMRPLQMMQKFYNSYSRRKQSNNEEEKCRYERNRTNSADKMTSFLIKHMIRMNGKSAQSSNNYKSNQLQTVTPNRYSSGHTETSKRCYFKSVYSESNPLLTTQHKIAEKEVEKVRKMETEPIDLIGFYEEDHRLISPLEKRLASNNIKQKLLKIQHAKRQKMEKIRYNYIVKKCFSHKTAEEDNTLPKTKCENFSKTKQSIFPS